VLAGDTDGDITSNKCDISFQPARHGHRRRGPAPRRWCVSYLQPTATIRAAIRLRPIAFTPTAALLKATMIAAARAVAISCDAERTRRRCRPVPSPVQGWGFPVLDDALPYFPGGPVALEDRRRRRSRWDQTATLHLQVNAGNSFESGAGLDRSSRHGQHRYDAESG